MKRHNVHFEKGPVGWLQRYALFSYDHPVALFFGLFVFILFLAFLGGIFGFKLADVDHEWEIKTNTHVKQNAAIDEAQDDISSEKIERPFSVEETELDIFVTYEVKRGEDRNIFTEENLLSQREVENTLMEGTYGIVCLRDYTDAEEGVIPDRCLPPLSVLLHFFEYDELTHRFGDWLTGNPTEDIANGIREINQDPFFNAFFLDKSYEAGTNEVTIFTRSRFQLGLPIDTTEFRKGMKEIADGKSPTKYNNSKIDEEDQIDDVYDEFLDPMESRLFDLLDMKSKPLRTKYQDLGELGNLEVIFYNSKLASEETNNLVLMDFMWAGLSILSVWLYMLLHLGSVFLSLVGILEIFLSFPVALFFYKPVFQIDYFSEINLLVIFILLGIGADDIFVYTDAYKQSGSVPNVDPSLQGRLMYATSRASKAVFVTSFTTMAAFFATAVSSLMPMQAFGIFAALCIVFLFTINVLIMPPALVLYAGYTPYLTKWVCPCCIPDRRPAWVATYLPCCSCCHVDIDETFFLPMAEVVEKRTAHGEVEMTSAEDHGPPHIEEGSREEAATSHRPREAIVLRRTSSLADADLNKLRSIEKFFYGPFFIFIDRFKWIIIALGVAIFCVGIGFVTTFKTPDEAEEWFPSDHAFHRFQNLFDNNKTPYKDSSEDNVAEVSLVWGLKGMDASKRDLWDGDDFGDLEYDRNFDLRPRANQQFVHDVCARVRRASCNAAACNEPFLIKLNRGTDVDLDDQQICWIEDFAVWVNATRGLSFPVDPDDLLGLIEDYLEVDQKKVQFGEFIGYSTRDRELKFIIFEFDSTFRPPSSSSKTKRVIDEWEDFIKAVNKDAEDQNLTGVEKAFESGGDAWTWPATSDALVSGAISGLILVFVLAFVVLNFANGNLMISVIAVMTIAGIVATVMGVGIRAIRDWDLGTAESITIVILIGFSMDYTLHLSDAYMESPHSNRQDRTRDALTHLGISVTAGAFTTLVSALFLWATVLVFFQKFAFNVTATVFTSLLFSMFVFPSLCLVMGPEGDWGRWRIMIRWTRDKIKDVFGRGGTAETTKMTTQEAET